MRDSYSERDLAVLKEVSDFLDKKPVPTKDRQMRGRMCGGCGETNPNKRCLGCRHDFGG